MTYYFNKSQTGGIGVQRFNKGVNKFKKRMRRMQRLNRRVEARNVFKPWQTKDQFLKGMN